MFISRNMDFTERLGSLKAFFLAVCLAVTQISDILFYFFAFAHLWKSNGVDRMRIKSSGVTQTEAKRATSTYLRVSVVFRASISRGYFHAVQDELIHQPSGLIPSSDLGAV